MLITIIKYFIVECTGTWEAQLHTPCDSYAEARARIISKIHGKYGRETCDNGTKIADVYASALPEKEPKASDGWIECTDHFKIYKFTFVINTETTNKP